MFVKLVCYALSERSAIETGADNNNIVRTQHQIISQGYSKLDNFECGAEILFYDAALLISLVHA